ncbi:MAG: NAD(P)-binding domain-containing protein, partial [Methyloprofundus sp.]|nr:NAD(P)-binding domain-containing protein [Methyloprofundus sp.]
MSDSKHYDIVIIGSGPGGMSAAGRAEESGLNYVLLEATPHLSYTIYLYQKGKHVMDEPAILPLRSTFEFTAESREEILEKWASKLSSLKVNIQYNSYVEKISGESGDFTIQIKEGGIIKANKVVLGIGLQGNIRKMGVTGEDLPFVQYQLDDPEEYEDETIVVIGAGDAAIENALALAKQNNVIIINRKNEFARAKKGNLNDITKAIETGAIECYYNSTSRHVESYDKPAENGELGVLSLNTDEGTTDIPIHRIIARLGAIPPRRFVESCGIVFPSDDPAAVPAISETYESNVPGLHIVGALGGNPLIKAAMNQGYEVIEHIQGNPIEPADEPLLKEKFAHLDASLSVSELLSQLYKALPFLKSLTTLQFREFILDSEIRLPQPGETLYEINDF